jgi:hypothetical protein
LAIYSVVGTLIFIMLAAFAAALSYAGRRLGGEIGVASVGIGILSNALAVTNLLLYLIFLYRLIRKVLSEI